MKKLIVLLCALCFVLAYAETAFAPPASKTPTTTLNDIPPAWSKTLQCDTTTCPRFELVLGEAAVLDHETGLVWEKSPGTITFWTGAIATCATVEVGGRKGWHLPTIEQLASLMDTSVAGTPQLPAGHPFTGVQSSPYWSATTDANDATIAWVQTFGGGFFNGYNKANALNVWCVRGGQSYDGK